MRPIDADALLKSMEDSAQELRTIIDSLSDEVDKGIAKGQLISFLECKMRTREVPTLTLDDLRPHGRWRKECVAGFNKAFCTVFVCSECEGRYSVPFMKYCPACGSKMDLEEGQG